MGKTVVAGEGDSIDSIAFAEGFAPDTLWSLPENRWLAEAGRKRSVLREGDEVVVPDLRAKEEKRGTDLVHPFKRKGVPALFRLRYLDDDEPLADRAWMIAVAGKRLRGRTDADGELVARLPPNVTRAQLTFEGMETVELAFGRLEPVDTHRGVAQRLLNLGYSVDGPGEREATAAFTKALKAFQHAVGLSATGSADEATREALATAHEPDA